jgi:hypothetical protein
MKNALWFLPLLAIIVSAMLTPRAFPDHSGGSCPGSNNACTEPDGCPVLQQTKYIDWFGMRRCTWGFEGCENDLSLKCKDVYTCAPGCGAIIPGPTPEYECGYAGNGYSNPAGNGTCQTTGPQP